MIDYCYDEAMFHQDETFHPDELPIWKDYESIGTFQDYEFTQCIAYEMAIRDPINKEKVDAIMALYNKYKNTVDNYIKNHRQKGATKGGGVFHTIKHLIEEIEVIPFNYRNSYIEYKEVHIFSKEFYDLLDLIMKYFSIQNPKTHGNALTIIRKGFKLSETIKNLQQDGYEVIKNLQLNKDDKNTASILSINQEKKSMDMIHLVEKDGYVIITEISIPQNELLLIKNWQKNDHKILGEVPISDLPSTVKEFASIIKNFEYSDGSSLLTTNVVKSNIKIKEKFKRPKLQLNSNSKKNMIAEIDMTRPEKEIIAYIKHLKKDINATDCESMIPSNLLDSIILNEYVHNENQHNSTSRMADKDKIQLQAKRFEEMFFIWDYIETRARNNNRHNAILKKNYDEKVKYIKESRNIDLNRTEKIENAKEYYMKNQFNISKRELCKDADSQEDIGIPSGTIVNRYEDLRPFILEKKYLELVSNNRK